MILKVSILSRLPQPSLAHHCSGITVINSSPAFNFFSSNLQLSYSFSSMITRKSLFLSNREGTKIVWHNFFLSIKIILTPTICLHHLSGPNLAWVGRGSTPVRRLLVYLHLTMPESQSPFPHGLISSSLLSYYVPNVSSCC